MSETQGMFIEAPSLSHCTVSVPSSDINNEASCKMPKQARIPVQLFPNTITKIQFLANIFIFRQSFITPATTSKKTAYLLTFLI
jgi:hypothetical protein